MSREKRLWSINFMLEVCFQSEIFSLSVKVSSPPSQVGSVQLQQSRGRNFTLCTCNLLTSECRYWGRGMGLYTRDKECICTSQTLCVCVWWGVGVLWLMQWIALHCNDEKKLPVKVWINLVKNYMYRNDLLLHYMYMHLQWKNGINS